MRSTVFVRCRSVLCIVRVLFPLCTMDSSTSTSSSRVPFTSATVNSPSIPAMLTWHCQVRLRPHFIESKLRILKNGIRHGRASTPTKQPPNVSLPKRTNPSSSTYIHQFRTSLRCTFAEHNFALRIGHTPRCQPDIRGPHALILHLHVVVENGMREHDLELASCEVASRTRMTPVSESEELWGGGNDIIFLTILLEPHFRKAEAVKLFRIFFLEEYGCHSQMCNPPWQFVPSRLFLSA